MCKILIEPIQGFGQSATSVNLMVTDPADGNPIKCDYAVCLDDGGVLKSDSMSFLPTEVQGWGSDYWGADTYMLAQIPNFNCVPLPRDQQPQWGPQTPVADNQDENPA